MVEVLNEEKSLLTGVNEIVHAVYSLEKLVVELLNEEKDIQTGVTGVLHVCGMMSVVMEISSILCCQH